MPYETLTAEIVEPGIGLVTLSRPDQYNTWTPKMMEELIESFTRFDQDDDVRAMVITGSGQAYCAGLDLSMATDKALAAGVGSGETPRDTAGRFTLTVFDMKTPVIAAINGAAVGVGVTMTLPMDIRIASDQARFGFIFNRRGLVPEGCSTWFLPRLVGVSRAAEWLITGRIFSAAEALEGGLISRVVPPDKLRDTALELARDIAQNSSAISVSLTRQLLWKSLGADHPMEAHRLESRCLQFMFPTDDFKEGVTSFLEKRPARFTMKPEKELPEFYPWWPDVPY